MRAADLHRLARRLREAALLATGNEGEGRAGFGEVAVVEDVAAHPGATIGAIADRTGLAQSLVSRLVRRLAAAGVLQIDRDAADARRTLVSLDPRTRDEVLRPRGSRPIAPSLVQAFPHLGAEDVRRLESLLDQVLRLTAPPD